MLLDSNIIIYSAQPEHSQLRELIGEHSPAVSALSYLEVLGYHLLTEQQHQYFEEFFQTIQMQRTDESR
ncbi:MAG: type II toxin-antitoxin system VapC family toxin [Cyanobacteria bacterium CRU_2_1]|nr:type II toxin-antitoxin system VapC family toxin [Cyanobacteria bacterium CRU_2_1]